MLDQLFLMADDDLKQFFAMLPSGVIATVVTDCCHSGTLLDGTEVVIAGSKDDDSEFPEAESEALLETLNGSRGYEVSVPRSLPIDVICNVMSQKLGTDVPPTSSGVNGAMAQVFGGTAGKFMFKFAMSQLEKYGGQDDGPGNLVNVLTGLLGAAGPGSTHTSSSHHGGSGGGSFSGLGGAIGGLISGFLGGDSHGHSTSHQTAEPGDNPMSAIAAMMSNIGLEGSPQLGSHHAPPYNPQHGAISRDVCTLITGCQSHETSADVRPANGGAYGALTKTLTDVEREHENISYYELVMKVRKALSSGGFKQNPCLETTENQARNVFICDT